LTSTDKAAVLAEALPYLQRFRGKTFLIKIGGSAMDDEELLSTLMRDIVFLEVAGINPILVHGGGKFISAAMEKAGLEAKFVGGLRVTSPEAIAIVEETLGGTINPKLVELINNHGGRATGIPGTGVFKARRIKARSGTASGSDEEIDIGRVGEVDHCLTDDVLYATTSEIVPVISPLGSELETGKPLNINADLAAAALACTLKPAKLVYVSDVPGLLADSADPDSLIPTVTPDEAHGMIESGVISGGMIPKINSALEALEAGVDKVHFVDGRVPHTVLLEIFTEQGIGTQIRKKP
jgi:acetylglutamate kinase